MKNSTLLAVLFVVVSTSLSGVASAGRRVPLAKAGRKTFYVVDGVDSVGWEDAKAACKSVGLVMSVVANEAESDALAAASLERAKQNLPHYIWLGAIFRKEDQKWVWESNGQELVYTNWREGARLGDTGSSSFSNCGYIDTNPGWGTWACGAGSGYEFGLPVCQKP